MKTSAVSSSEPSPAGKPGACAYTPAALEQALPLLGGLSASQFMRRYWQRKPLLVRQAWPGVQPPVARSALFALAAQADVESRLITRRVARQREAWTLSKGPFARRALPALKQPDWTLLIQGLDLHARAAHEMLARFRFVPQARLDDLMISYATDGGGVGPHFDSYDVFLLQVHGRRRWRIGRLDDPCLVPDMPLKILANFKSEQEWVLEPGDMLYLPPRWAHDGQALGECMTCSVGFRAPMAQELAHDLLGRMLDADADDELGADRRYSDPGLAATHQPARIPPRLQEFAEQSVAELLRRQLRGKSLSLSLGESLTEPKAGIWFEPGAARRDGQGLLLHPRSRMMYDDHHVYLNGQAWRAAGADARLLRHLADQGGLNAQQLISASAETQALLADWLAAGWLQAH